MFYNGYAFWGMDIVWWCIWGMLLVWIFATPRAIPGQRWVIYSRLDILKKRFASGKMTKLGYQEQKEILEKDSAG